MSAQPLPEEISADSRNRLEPGMESAERQALIRVLSAVGARRQASEAYKDIAEELRALLGAGTVAVGLSTPGSDAMDFVAVAGRDPAEIVGLRVAAEDTLADPALRYGRAMLLKPDTRAGVRTGAIAPIITPTGIVGAIIAVDRDQPAQFEEVDLSTLALFAGAAGLVVECDRATRTLSEKERELAALYDAAHTITSTVNLPAVLESVLDAINQHVPVQTAAVYLLNDERTHLFITAERGLSDEEREVQLAADAGIAGEVLASNEPRVIHDIGDDPDLGTLSPSSRTRSLMVAPITSAGGSDSLAGPSGLAGAHGLLIVTSAQPAAYRDDDLRLLRAVATQAGIAIQNATLFEDATRRAEASNALFTFSQTVGATLQTSEVLGCVADTAVSLLEVDKIAVMLMDHRDGRLRPSLVRGLDESSFSRFRPRSGEGIAGWVYAWSCPTAVADVAADARNRSAPIHQEGAVSCICVPIGSGETVQGVLLVMSSRRRLFTVAEMEMLYTIANQASLAMVNATAYQRAQERTLAMRRYFRRFASAIGSSIERAHMLQLVTDVALDVMEADRCAIYRLDGEVLALQADSRLQGRCPPDASLRIGEGLTGAVAGTGHILTVSPVSEDARAAAHAWHAREQVASYIGLPLKAGRRVTGVLELMTSKPRTFAPDEVRLISQFILRARLGERLHEVHET